MTEAATAPAPEQNPTEPPTEPPTDPPAEPPTDPPTDPPAEPPAEAQGTTPEEWEKRFKALEKVYARYTTQVGDIFAEDAKDLLPCPLCTVAVPGFVDVNAAGRIPEEAKVATETYLGVVQEADYEPDPAYQTCDMCNGGGTLRRPTRVATFKLAPCRKCKGTGILPPPGVDPDSGAIAAPPALAAVPGPSPVPDAEADPFGHPRLLEDGMQNPNYGKMPAFVDPRFP